MLRVCASNRTEALLEALVEKVRAERLEKGPFEPIRMVVPNRSVETYLRLNLAQALGIAANLEVTFLRKLLVRVAGGAKPSQPSALVTAPQIEGHLLALLHDDALLAQPVYAPVRAYLHAGGHDAFGRDALDRRRCQLAHRLGELFEEYSTSRAEMVHAWAKGPQLADQPIFAETEAWQRALWLEIFGRTGRVARRTQAEGHPWLRLDELLTRVEQLDTTAVGGVLHLFGVSYMAPAYHRMLATLARRSDVYLYTLNPCREFWEDVETRAEQRRHPHDDPFGLLDTENLALQLWGRPGRENIRLLGQHTGCDFDERFVSAGGVRPTLLQRLQNDILDRAARTAPPPDGRVDGSLRVVRCPGIRRELEITAADIWSCLRADPTLRCNDIAVIVPESRKQDYLSLVSAVFAESRELPASVVDLPLGGGNRLGTAVELLLDLPLSSFTRRELLPLVTHPCVMARFPEAEPERWLELADDLGIVRGADHADLHGTYIERDLFTWDQGLRRLALGAFMTARSGGEPRPFVLGEQSYLPAEAVEDTSLQFGLLVRSLLSDARWAREGERPLGDWLVFMRGLLTTYLIPSDGAEEGLLARCLAELNSLEELGLGELPISYRVAAELARQALAGVSGARGQYLASGVTVSSFVPMRALPFRVVFVLGLGQENFPRPDTRDELDLRRALRAPGDVGRREQDRYMFLETLLCARDRLVLSYVGRNEITGEDLPMSTVLLELRDILARDHLPEPAVKALFDDERPPLHRFHDETRLDALPAAHREHVAEQLGQSLRQNTATLEDWAPLRARLNEPTRALVDRHLQGRMPLQIPSGSRPRAERITITLAQLRRFLEDPLQGSARFRLRMRDDDSDDADVEVEDEPFELANSERGRVLSQALTQAVLAAVDGRPEWSSVLAAWNRWADLAELTGRAPTGFFRQASQRLNETVLRQWTDLLHEATPVPTRAQVVRWGRADEHAAGNVRDAITLDLPGLQVELSGSTQLLLEQRDQRASLRFATSSEYAQRTRDRDTLRAFIDHVILAASQIDQAHASLVLWTDGHAPKAFIESFRPLDGERARAYLTAIVADLLAGSLDGNGQGTGVHAYLLPCEAVFAATRTGANAAVETQRLREEYLASDRKKFSSVWGPVPDAVERHLPPSESEAQTMAERRFGLLFDLLQPHPDASTKEKKRRGKT